MSRLCWILLLPCAVSLSGYGCDSSSSGDGGQGGQTLTCPSNPQALYTVHVTALDGPVPPDTRLRVRWSAGEEPEIVLSDPETWKSLEEGSNVDCHLDKDDPPPDLDRLTCELWTSGATNIEILAAGYLTHEETLTPLQSDECEVPIPKQVEVKLSPDLDAGTL